MLKSIFKTIIKFVPVVICFLILLKMGLEPLQAAILIFLVKCMFRFVIRILSCLLVSFAIAASFIYLLISL